MKIKQLLISGYDTSNLPKDILSAIALLSSYSAKELAQMPEKIELLDLETFLAIAAFTPYDPLVKSIAAQIEPAMNDGVNTQAVTLASGGNLSKTIAPKSERIYGSKINLPQSASSSATAASIELSDSIITAIENKVEEHNRLHPTKKVSLSAAKAVVRRGMGAYSSSHRPTITGGRPNSRVAWGLARLNAFLFKAANGESKSGRYNQDDDLLNELLEKGGKIGGALDVILEEIKPFQEKLTQKYIENMAQQHPDIVLTSWDIEMYRLSLVMGLVKAVGNYLEDTDVVKNIKTSELGDSIVISCIIERNGTDHKFSTEAILAGGYNIQQLHYRYLVHTKLPHKHTNTAYNNLNEQYKKLTKAQKIKLEISHIEKKIERYKKAIEEAKENQLLTDSEIEALDRKSNDSWRMVDTTWETIIERGADQNFDFDKSKFEKSREEYRQTLIKHWKYRKATPATYEISLKAEQKNIEKLNKKLTELTPGKMQEGGAMQLELFDSIKPFSEKEIDEVPVDKFRGTPEQLTKLRLENPSPQLTMFSFGGGQDSWCILYKLIYDNDFRQKYAPNDLVIAMSDTGNEFPYTYKYLREAMAIAKEKGIHFQFITSDQGYHTEGWPNLKYNLKKNDNILSATMQRQPCTVNLKINVVDKYMHHYMMQKYFSDISVKNKNGWKLYKEKFKTNARVLIGFAKDEEARVVKSHRMHQAKDENGKPILPRWKIDNIQYCYPLLEEGWDRAAAQEIILNYREDLPPPSNCMICFYQSDQEILWLERNYPKEFYEWVELEAKKLEKFKHKEKNYGVYGTINLIQKLNMAKLKYGHWTNEQLWEYKMSHGHCVKSVY
jgi:hypothetical protein